MNIDKLKNEWQSLNTASTVSHDSMVKDIVEGKITSARERLMKQYKNMFSVITPLGYVALSALLFFDCFPLYLIVATTIYFATAGVMDYYLYKGIKGLDLSTGGVTQIAAKAKFYRRRHHQFQLILFPMVIALIILFFGCTNEWQQLGIVVGIIIGIAVGIPTYISIMRDFKQLSN
jgi:hypothetical protein